MNTNFKLTLNNWCFWQPLSADDVLLYCCNYKCKILCNIFSNIQIIFCGYLKMIQVPISEPICPRVASYLDLIWMWMKHLCLLFHDKTAFSNRKEEKNNGRLVCKLRDYDSHGEACSLLTLNKLYSAEKIQNIFLAEGNLQLWLICFHIVFWWGEKTKLKII